MAHTLLIVEDEPDLARILEFNLSRAGYRTLVAPDGETALRLARSDRPALVLLDLMLPDVSGLEVCRQIRREPSLAGTRILMLTARGEEVDRVVGFELGADDYVTKPFSVRELMLRIAAVLRRSDADAAPGPTGLLELGLITVDPVAHACTVAGEPVKLTVLELKLLATLLSRTGRVQSREQLLQDVWDLSPELETRTVDTHVKRLREKLGLARDYIETLRGVGYVCRIPS